MTTPTITSSPGPPEKPKTSPTDPNVQTYPTLGLTLITEFITPDEENALIDLFHSSVSTPPSTPSSKSKPKRLSLHFGHHFDYTTFGTLPTPSPIPPSFLPVLSRLQGQPPLRPTDPPPSQFTLQYYPPGAGIPPHVDTHSFFGEALYSLSFGSPVPMVFKLAGKNEARKMRLPKRSLGGDAGTGGGEVAGGEEEEECEEPWELWLPSRSLLIMTGKARYGYTHGIKGRKTDVVDGKQVVREGRYSVTMRSVRRQQEVGCDCEFPGVCDARIREEQAREAEMAAEGMTDA